MSSTSDAKPSVLRVYVVLAGGLLAIFGSKYFLGLNANLHFNELPSTIDIPANLVSKQLGGGKLSVPLIARDVLPTVVPSQFTSLSP